MTRICQSVRRGPVRILAVAAAVAAFIAATLSPVQATQRMVLVESFTNSG
jgi:hypothetical protein